MLSSEHLKLVYFAYFHSSMLHGIVIGKFKSISYLKENTKLWQT